MLSNQWETLQEIRDRNGATDEALLDALQEAARLRQIETRMEEREGVKVCVHRLRA